MEYLKEKGANSKFISESQVSKVKGYRNSASVTLYIKMWTDQNE